MVADPVYEHSTRDLNSGPKRKPGACFPFLDFGCAIQFIGFGIMITCVPGDSKDNKSSCKIYLQHLLQLVIAPVN